MKVRQDKKRAKFSFGLVFLLILASFAVCFYLYMKAGQLSNEVITASGEIIETSSSQTETSNETTTIEKVADRKKLIVNPVPEGDKLSKAFLINECNFVGDSITVGLSSYGILPEKNVLAGVGMNVSKINTDTITTVDGEKTVIDALVKNAPKNVYIMLGSNGISWLSFETMYNEYGDFIDSIKQELPECTIYILTIPPVTANKETNSSTPILNSDIDTYNSGLLSLANEKEVYLVDLNTALKGNDGKLPSDLSDGDGMHFKKSTYDIMLDYLLTHTIN